MFVDQKFNLIYYIYLLLLFLINISCNSSFTNIDELDNLENLQVEYTIHGLSNLFPSGDGSGLVTFNVVASNAELYKILVENEVLQSSTGVFQYKFKKFGINNFNVVVSAYRGLQNISKTISLTIWVEPQLVWSDEFNTNGAPDSNKWGYNIGAGGWGNNELQYYTNRPENVIIENGVLKIKLIKENYMGSQYTSARLLSQGKFDFKYGKIEFRAKLPFGGGTWPALWMLGNNIGQVGWPTCGEIDVMEHVGNQLNKIYATLHYPEHYGANGSGNTIMINDVTTVFHNYSAEWDVQTIKFCVDNQLFYTFNNSASVPFNQNFFIIMNCAMGGNFGGSVDPNITSANFEIDYVRVYQ